MIPARPKLPERVRQIEAAHPAFPWLARALADIQNLMAAARYITTLNPNFNHIYDRSTLRSLYTLCKTKRGNERWVISSPLRSKAEQTSKNGAV
jgi:hypothetical protein